MQKEELMSIITDSFANISREDGITLHEAMALDDYLSEEELIKARSKDTDQNWRDIDPHQLKGMESSLSFFDAKGFRYYLPVFMIAELSGCIDLATSFHHLTQLYPFSMRKTTPEMIQEKYQFNSAQMRAIALYLLYVSEMNDLHQSKAELEVVERWKKYV